MKKKIIYPVYKNIHKDDKPIKEGSIDGVSLNVIWKECQEYAVKYFNNKMKTDEKFRKLMDETDETDETEEGVQ